MENIGNGSYLFTQGLLGNVEEQKVILRAGTFSLKTEFSFTPTDLRKLEDQYNIKLVGRYYPDAEYMARNLAIDELRMLTSNGEFWRFREIIDEVGNYLSIIRYQLRLVIFKDRDLANFLVDRIPPGFLVDGGISDGTPISKDFFEQMLNRTSWNDQSYKYKIIYYFDVISLIDDFYNHFINIGHRLLSVEYELHKYLSAILEQDDPFPALGEEVRVDCEYAISGWQTLKIHQLYMDCVIGLYSLLDVFSKIAFELLNLPSNFGNVVKLNSNGRYFTDLHGLNLPNVEGFDLNKTIFKKTEEYKELSLLRHEFVHRSSLSPLPKVYYGRGTDIVNGEAICYACCFLWDIDEGGNPIRWKNRYRFYSQKRMIDHFIIKWTKKVSNDLFYTLQYLSEYTDTLVAQIDVSNKIDLKTAIPILEYDKRD